MSLKEAVKSKKKRNNTEQKDAAIADITKESIKRLNVNVPSSVYQRFKVKAAVQDTDMSAIVNQWILDYLEQEE